MSWNKRYEGWYSLPAGRPREITKVNIKDHYTVIRTLDGGNIRIGALNHGVHLVKRKVDGKVCVQKGVMADHKYLRRKIHLLHHLKHPDIVEFVNAFTTSRPGEACLYMAYCELGGLHGIVTRYVEAVWMSILHLLVSVVDVVAIRESSQRFTLQQSRTFFTASSAYHSQHYTVTVETC